LEDAADNRQAIRILPDGPYVVPAGIPLVRQTIRRDETGFPSGWQEQERYHIEGPYRLCRCGQSRNKPFCDGSHLSAGFDGTETDRNVPYEERARVFHGPDLDLYDAREFCAAARFCDRLEGAWKLLSHADDPEVRRILEEQVRNCPSGRLMLRDKSGNSLEPDYEPGIVIIEDPHEEMDGPLWVRGGIPIQSADGSFYEVRNRVALCRCGKSQNKPFCDGSHCREE
jgi:CDGSH-type Zn-finger protein